MSKIPLESPAATAVAAGYEPPRVERILDSAELDREVRYAGKDNTVHG